MITIEYAKDDSGEAIPDCQVGKWIDDITCFDVNYWLKVSTENVIHEISARVAEGRLHHDKIEFHYNGITIDIDESGYYDYHEGFADTMSKCMVRLLCPGRK